MKSDDVTFYGAYLLYLAIWGAGIGGVVLFFRSMLRLVRSQERIAAALERIASKQ